MITIPVALILIGLVALVVGARPIGAVLLILGVLLLIAAR